MSAPELHLEKPAIFGLENTECSVAISSIGSLHNSPNKTIMKIIRLTSEESNSIFLNSIHIIAFWRNPEATLTTIQCTGDCPNRVYEMTLCKEHPEVIRKMLNGTKETAPEPASKNPLKDFKLDL